MITGLLLAVTLQVANPQNVARPGEIIEITCKAPVIVHEAGKTLVSQRIGDTLLFQADFAASETKQFELIPGNETYPPLVNAMFVSQRADDFSWENDKIAFRMYGPALEKKDGPQSGIDVWVKRVTKLVAADWYKSGKYHTDNGDGLDAYTVGRTRGCGGTALWQDGKLIPTGNFTTWKIIATGPLRCVFELTYPTETKRISLDAGSQLNRIESAFTVTGTAAVGIANRGKATLGTGWASVWEKADGKDNGLIGTGIVVPGAEFKEAEKHALAIVPVKANAPIAYYAGAGWSKAGFADQAAWNYYLAEFAARLQSPLKVSWKSN